MSRIDAPAVPTPVTTAAPIPGPVPTSLMGTIRKNVGEPQFQIQFFSGVAGNLASVGLQWISHAAMVLYERSINYKKEDLAEATRQYDKGVELLRMFEYPDALQHFTHAKTHFERTLFAFSKTNIRLHQLYYTICYNQAFVYVQHGDLHKARTVLLQAEQQLQTWGAVYRDYDVCNLIGVTYLKEGNFPEARKRFEKSLAINPNQRDIIYLRVFTAAKVSVSDEKLKPIDQEGFDYLAGTKLFKVEMMSPVAFEVNMALILTLKDTNPVKSFILFQQLETLYAVANISYSDRMHIYTVGISILQELRNPPMPSDEKAVKSNGSGAVGTSVLSALKEERPQANMTTLFASIAEYNHFRDFLSTPGEIDKRIKAFETKKKIEEDAYKLYQAQSKVDTKADAKSSCVPQAAADQKQLEAESDAKQKSQDKVRLFKIGGGIATAMAFASVVTANIMKPGGSR